ncbi:MAG: ABC transporter ATP-binding protein [Lachnospiraceae bacterium]|nr:ABC transporter ATP-binding protein [Lachnospiraceae bacterium]
MEIVLKNLTMKFPGRDRKKKEEVVAVNDFTFTIPDGELIGLLGPSGCGKSTTLNLISGLLKPTEGKIFFGKDDVTNLAPEHRGIGLVFQNYALYPHLTVRQNILFPLENRKGKDRLSKEQMRKMADEAAHLVQIDQLMDRRPAELSGGQQQRVAIARALVKQPRVLLLDEPLSNLDARLRLQTRDEIRRIQRETGITTIFVTHDQDEAMSISDRIVVMKEGVVQQTGKPQEVYDSPANLFVAKFLGTPPINEFEGRLRDGWLFIGENRVLRVQGESGQRTDAQQQVWVGVRPEGFLLREDGPFVCDLGGVEVMGRDISVLSRNRASVNPTVRSIISTESRVDTSRPTVRFALRPEKVFLFDKKTEARIRCGLLGEAASCAADSFHNRPENAHAAKMESPDAADAAHAEPTDRQEVRR